MFTFESGTGGTQFTVEGSIEEMRIVSRFRKLGDIIMCSVDIHEAQQLLYLHYSYWLCTLST